MTENSDYLLDRLKKIEDEMKGKSDLIYKLVDVFKNFCELYGIEYVVIVGMESEENAQYYVRSGFDCGNTILAQLKKEIKEHEEGGS